MAVAARALGIALVNFAGMVAGDVLRGDMPVTHWSSGEEGFLLDVRQPEELAVESVPGAVNIPLGELRARLDELPRDREIHVILPLILLPTARRMGARVTGLDAGAEAQPARSNQ